MKQTVIRNATPEDLNVIQSIGRETFFETFAASNTAADMNDYLEKSFHEDKLSAELNHPESRFFIAWEDQTPIGYLKVNWGQAQTELKDDTALEIERIYVRSSHQGQQVGRLLYEKALETARLLGKPAIWLGVWEANARAIRFYQKNGFVAFDQHCFIVGNDVQTDILMRKALA